MKLLIAFLTLFVVTATSQAQVPFYGGYPGYTNLQAYYPGAIAPPYYPQAYYPQLYGLQPAYAPFGYEVNQLSVFDNFEAVDTLERRVRQLSDEVRMLEAQLTVTQAEVQRQPEVSRPSEPRTPVVLVLKNGTRIEAQGYAAVGDTLWILNPFGSERIAIWNLNIQATQRENYRRGIDFPNLGN